MLGFKSVKAALLISMLGFIGAVTSTQASAACSFVSTKNGSPLPIKATATDTPQAKEFLETCINPYTKAYAADASLITQKTPKGGKALFGYNGCSGCHGGKLEGVMAPSLRKDGGQGAFDTKWVYAKNATDKGMFETISGGSAGVSGGVMSTWNINLADHVGDGLTNDEILRLIAYIRSEYRGDGEKTWLK